MIYQTDKKTYYYLGAVVLLLIFFNFFGWLNPVKNFLVYSLSPILAGTNKWGIKMGDSYRFFNSREEFFSAYTQCVGDLQGQELIKAQLKILAEENTELKKQLSFKQRAKAPQMAAEVVGKNTDSADKTIIINVGEEAGLKVDQPVVAGDGILVGKITKVEKQLAVVRLISDNQIKVAATVLNNERSLGVVEGGYGLSVRMSFIPRNEVVQVGDQIITSGLELNIPRGLLIGSVAAVENEPYQPFQQAVLTPAADLAKLTLVSVLLTN
ncbi:MAG: rod shape-determining protein MreC [Patescibacteria group bacterium]